MIELCVSARMLLISGGARCGSSGNLSRRPDPLPGQASETNRCVGEAYKNTEVQKS